MGVILYELLAGRPPFSGADDFELISAHLHDDPPPLSASAAVELPALVIDVVERALAKDPDHRSANAEAMAEAIEAAAQTITPRSDGAFAVDRDAHRGVALVDVDGRAGDAAGERASTGTRRCAPTSSAVIGSGSGELRRV